MSVPVLFLEACLMLLCLLPIVCLSIPHVLTLVVHDGGCGGGYLCQTSWISWCCCYSFWSGPVVPQFYPSGSAVPRFPAPAATTKRGRGGGVVAAYAFDVSVCTRGFAVSLNLKTDPKQPRRNGPVRPCSVCGHGASTLFLPGCDFVPIIWN